jgi:uncharacterized protein YndB with AHSA1/START domain
MDVKPSTGIAPSISDEAVSAKTGKVWDEWFTELDRAGALNWDHKAIAKHLVDGYPVGGWWSQMIAVTYEQNRGLRDKHQQKDGYQIQRTRTVAVPVPKAWRACKNDERRLEWLPEAEAASIRNIREDTRLMLRLNWPDNTVVLIVVNPKDGDKCVVGVEQSKLPDRATARRAKQFWSDRLGELKKQLEVD